MPAAPLTANRLDRCLNTLAVIMQQRDAADRLKLVPVYQRLEREHAALAAQEAALASAASRAKRFQDQTAGQSA